MKKQLLFIIFIFSFLQQSFSQNPLVKQWDYRFGGTLPDYVFSFQQTHDMGYILGGFSNSGIGGDKTEPLVGLADYWIVKTDSLGIKQWDKDLGGTDADLLYSIQQTNDRGYILGGHSLSDSSGDKTQNNWGAHDYWIVKTDSLGNKQWDKNFGGTEADLFYSVQQTDDGGYIFGGPSMSDSSGDRTQPSWGGYDYWIVKTDSLGNKQWDKRFGGTGFDMLFSIQQTNDGGYILGGHSTSGSNGDKTQPSWGNADYWIVKTDSLGAKQWDKSFGGTDLDELLSMQQTADGGYILGGETRSGISGDKSEPNWDTICIPNCTRDYWIIKTDAVGNKQWDKRYGGTDNEEMHLITQAQDGRYIVAGSSYSDISGDKSEDNLGLEQTWVVITDSIGNKQWDKTIFTLGHDEQSMVVQVNDECYTMVNYSNAGIGGYKTQPSWGNADYWLIKFCDSTATTSITQLPDTELPFSIYPNPANETLVISDKRTAISDKGTAIRDKGTVIREIEIYDLFGRTVLQWSMVNGQWSIVNGPSSITIDVSKLSPGIYFIKAGNEVRKFIKN